MSSYGLFVFVGLYVLTFGFFLKVLHLVLRVHSIYINLFLCPLLAYKLFCLLTIMKVSFFPYMFFVNLFQIVEIHYTVLYRETNFFFFQ